MHQEYQWARSFVILVLQYIRPFWSNMMSRREKIRIQMCIFYYFWHAVYPILVGLLVLLPCLGIPYGPCTWADVLLHASLPVAVSIVHCAWLGQQGWLRPKPAPVASWESALHQFVRTYWIMKGVTHAVVGHITGFQFAIAVTPKGDDDVRYMSQSTTWPFAVMAIICCAATWTGDEHVHVPFVFGLWNVLAMFLIIRCHILEQHKARTPWCNLVWVALPALSVACCQLVTMYHRGMLIGRLFRQTMGMLERTETAWDDDTMLQVAWLLVGMFGVMQLRQRKSIVAGKGRLLHVIKNMSRFISQVEGTAKANTVLGCLHTALVPTIVLRGEHMV